MKTAKIYVAGISSNKLKSLTSKHGNKVVTSIFEDAHYVIVFGKAALRRVYRKDKVFILLSERNPGLLKKNVKWLPIRKDRGNNITINTDLDLTLLTENNGDEQTFAE